MTLIKLEPFTRVNDSFVQTDRVDATPILHDVSHPLITSGPSGGLNSTHFSADFYKKIALDIVTETVFNYPYPRICEKTLRPINCKRMFIIFGATGSLKLLHSRGILTFGDIIDESYDTIENPEERFLAAVDSVEKFCQLDLDTIKTYYKNNSWKFDHNWQTMKNLLQAELQKFEQENNNV